MRKRVPAQWIYKSLDIFSTEYGRRYGRRYKISPESISVAIVGQLRMRKLNKLYRGKDRATNVLSFPFEGKDFLGEVILCLPVIRKEAKNLGRPLREYFQYIFVHGLLHLIGMDHKKNAQTKKMEQAEKRLLEKI